jgi:hypothetical protein
MKTSEPFGRLLLPVTVPVADAIVKLAVQLVTVPVGGVPQVLAITHRLRAVKSKLRHRDPPLTRVRAGGSC